MRVRGADEHSQANLSRWALGIATSSLLLGALLIQSGCDSTGEHAIESAFWPFHPFVTRRDGKIVELSFSGGFSDQDLKKLKLMADLTSLERLNLASTLVTDAGLVYISDCHKLKFLSVDYTTIGDDGLAHLRSLSALEQLNLVETHVSDRGLKHIEHLGNLEFLALMNTNISDEGAEHLDNLDKLKTLYVNGTRLADRGVESIAHLHQLRFLSFSNTLVGDGAAIHLAALDNLETLDLNKTDVTDEALPAFQSLTNLRFLDLKDTRVTEHGVDQLRHALPETVILYGPSQSDRESAP